MHMSGSLAARRKPVSRTRRVPPPLAELVRHRPRGHDVPMSSADREPLRALDLDRAATAPLRPEVRAAMDPWERAAGANPSARHAAGVRARAALDAAKLRIARCLGAEGCGIVLSSGGTEANNLGILGAAGAAPTRRRHLLVSMLEHPSVLEPVRGLRAQGFEVSLERFLGVTIVLANP